MKRKVLILITITLITMLYSCESETRFLDYTDEDTTISYSNFTVVESEFEITSNVEVDFEEGKVYFSESRDLNNLIDMQIFWSEENLNINFYFSKEASKDDIQKALDFYSCMILSHYAENSILGYNIVSLVRDNIVEDRVLRIFVDEELIIRTRHKYDVKFKIVDNEYFENNIMKLSQREDFVLVEDDHIEILTNKAVKNIEIIKAIRPFTIFVHIDLKVKNGKKLDALIRDIENEFEESYLEENMNELKKIGIKTIIITFFKDNDVLVEKKISLNDEDDFRWSKKIWD